VSTPTTAELVARWRRLRPELEASLAQLREARLTLEARFESPYDEAVERHNRKQALRLIKGGLDG
jgi:hypothetical protein